MESILQDLRFGARILYRSPATTFLVILALALGIGANSAMFGVVDALLLRPLTYADPDRLAIVWDRDVQGELRRVVEPQRELGRLALHLVGMLR